MEFLKFLPLAIGTFAIGTDLFMIAGILPVISRDLHVSLSATGALITVFAVVSAVSAPILASLLGQSDRRFIAMMSMFVFALANLFGAISTSYAFLFMSRIIAAGAAAIYTPCATAIAVVNVTHEHRGKAISMVTGGLTVSLVFGVPIGTLLAHLVSWRTTYLFVALVALFSLPGIRFLFPCVEIASCPNIRKRLSPLSNPSLAITLAQTTIVIAGTFVVYTYLGAFISRYLTSSPSDISLFLLLYGGGAIVGNFAGGRIIDRLGANLVAIIAVAGMAIVLSMLSFIGVSHLSDRTAFILFGASLVSWASIGWAFSPAQYARIAQLTTSANNMQIVFALNGSALQLGIALGALCGQWMVKHEMLVNIGWIGSIFELVGLGLIVIGLQKYPRISVRKNQP